MKYVWIQEGNRQRWKMSISESSEIKRWKKVDHQDKLPPTKSNQ